MSALPKIVADLEQGSTDLESCLCSLPELSVEDRLELVLAEQRYRFCQGLPCGADYYAEQFDWVARDSEARQKLLVAEFQLQISRAFEPEFLQHFLAKLDNCDDTLFSQLLHIEVQQRSALGLSVPWEAYLESFPDRRACIDELKVQCTFDRPLSANDSAALAAEHASATMVLSDDAIRTDVTRTFTSDAMVGELRGGRYRLVRRLGEGTYGAVYLAQDTQLKRQVAIKLPRPDTLARLGKIDSYLSEARNVASLDHPNIVAVYDVGRTAEGSLYVVSKFIDGGSLSEWLKTQPYDFRRIVICLERLAEALHHAHHRHLIHRDIKPANILIDAATGTPFVTDFGLAIREEDYLQEGRMAGTPAYMSPEQIRGEGHRLDGRSDLFSLGVVMYQMLTGRLPFPGQTFAEIMHQIIHVEPEPPSSLRKDIPSELDRICLKLLRKRASERYATGHDLATDLRSWLEPSATEARVATDQRITPRGLRSFTADDSAYFLNLLPGPRDRQGLPESISFWKSRIEQRDADKTFTVGLLYGPSGCGKSSLVKAGLIPNLSAEVIPIYIEATPEETESRLLRQLRKAVDDLPAELSLVEAAERIRRTSGPKVVLIIDQFEQWLHGQRVDVEGPLIRTLRQCDGGRLQTLLMIRDDFYLPAARLMYEIDVPIVTEQNFKLVDLFDREHARQVLIRFGQAFHKLPQSQEAMTPDQLEFVRQVIDGLSEDGRVVTVRLALLAEMLKGREWVPAALSTIGGLNGIGVNFLEETFASNRADPRHRQHLEAARGVLRVLLPETGLQIKGAMCSEEALLQASGYKDRPKDFQELMRILDGELRLVTPTNPEGQGSQSASDVFSQRFYQLTHDYLVHSLRQWLTRKQRETRQGRAELKLAERAAVWNNNRENKQLPTLNEWLQIRRWTDRRKWTDLESLLMRTAGRVHLRNWGSGVLALAVISLSIAYVFQQQSLRSRIEKIAVVLDSLQRTPGPSVAVNIDRLIDLNRPDLIRAELNRRYIAANKPNEKRSLAFALASFGRPESAYLISQIDSIDDGDTANFIEALARDRQTAVELLKTAIAACDTEKLWRRKARLSLAALGIGALEQAVVACEFEGRPDQAARSWFIDEFGRWALDRTKVLADIENSDSPALRSAACLMLGRVASELSPDVKEQLGQLASRWFAMPDSSTHCAAAWLLRQLGLPLPEVAEATEMVDARNWFVNSQNTTMVLVKPAIQRGSIPDPKLAYIEELKRLDAATDEERQQGTWRYDRALARYYSDDFEGALSDLNLLESPGSRSMGVVSYQTLCLARLNRKPEALRALEYMEDMARRATWNVNFYHWEPAGDKNLPADWESVIGSPVIAQLSTQTLNLNSSRSWPVEAVRRSHFAVVATRKLILNEKPMVFEIAYDDGIRIWIDEEVIYEDWELNAEKPMAITIENRPGSHILKIEYFQIDGRFALHWSQENESPSLLPYVRTVVPLLLGDRAIAAAAFEKSLAASDPADSLTLYNLACASALMAESEPVGSSQRQVWVEQALSLLERWSTGSNLARSQMLSDPDLRALFDEQRFFELTDDFTVPSRSFWLASHEVTRGEFEAFVEDESYQGPKPRNWKIDAEASPTRDHPAQGVSWYDALEFCNWLSLKEGRKPAYDLSEDPLFGSGYNLVPGADGYRLPPTAHWQYAALAGSSTSWGVGSDPVLLPAYCQMSSTQAGVCASKLPNAWGLHDMHGNVWEWCADIWQGDNRERHGGGFDNDAPRCAASARFFNPPAYRYRDIGFRIALPAR